MSRLATAVLLLGLAATALGSRSPFEEEDLELVNTGRDLKTWYGCHNTYDDPFCPSPPVASCISYKCAAGNPGVTEVDLSQCYTTGHNVLRSLAFEIHQDGKAWCYRLRQTYYDRYTLRPGNCYSSFHAKCGATIKVFPVDSTFVQRKEHLGWSSACGHHHRSSYDTCNSCAYSYKVDCGVSAGGSCVSDGPGGACVSGGAYDSNCSCKDSPSPKGTVCRDADGSRNGCDLPERCDGTSTTCPSDSFRPNGDECGDNEDLGPCQKPNACQDGQCETVFEDSDFVCGAGGSCTEQATCTGSSADCPDDTITPGESCTAPVELDDCVSGYTCSADGSCTTPVYKPSDHVCRPADDSGCDVPEFCTGSDPACPGKDTKENPGKICDAEVAKGPCGEVTTCNAAGECVVSFKPDTFECAAATDCKEAAFCTGSSVDCPARGNAPENSSCEGDGSDLSDCEGSRTCSNGVCKSNPKPDTFECRAGGECNPAEMCDGSSLVCPEDALSPNSEPCGADRPGGNCLSSRKCDGKGACLDHVFEAGHVCRPSTDQCDAAEVCDGESITCPGDDDVADETACDNNEDANRACAAKVVCKGGDCTVVPKSEGTPCGAAPGVCQVASVCDGESLDCPVFEDAEDGTACGEPVGGLCADTQQTCQAGVCTINYKPTSFECRPAVSACDTPEFCTGSDTVCPPDEDRDGDICDGEIGTARTVCVTGYQCAGTVCEAVVVPGSDQQVCREAASDCDKVEYCEGGLGCPADRMKADDMPCGPEEVGECQQQSVCKAGSCTEMFFDASTVCGAGGDCSEAATCTGSDPDCPADTITTGASCPAPVELGVCVEGYACSAEGACDVPVYRGADHVCRGSDESGCDVDETCTGNSPDCPENDYQVRGTPCGAALADCELSRECNNSGKCVTKLQLDDFVCRAADDSDCDVADTCTGADAECPAKDKKRPEGASCSGSGATGPCGSEFICTADGDCVIDYLEAGTKCAEASDCGPASFCTGDSVVCPMPELFADGTECAGDPEVPVGDCELKRVCEEGECVPKAKGPDAVCRPGGDCDAAETCDGVNLECPPDAISASGTPCGADRPAGDCLSSRKCNDSGECLDHFKTKGTVCRDPVDNCDAEEVCTGDSAECPEDEDLANDTVCKELAADAGECALAHKCKDGECVLTAKTAGTPCGPVPDVATCTVQATCDGDSMTCPSVGEADEGTVCGQTNAACAENNKVCAYGVCVFQYKAETMECRESTGDCDPAEMCTGSDADCPADVSADNGAACDGPIGEEGTECVERYECKAKTCTPVVMGENTTCRPADGECDIKEVCNGTAPGCGEDKKKNDGVTCGGYPAGPCQDDSVCTAGVCTEQFKGTDTVCRTGSGPCEPDTVCPGDEAACPEQVCAATPQVSEDSAGKDH